MPRVLIADDDPAIVGLVSATLEPEGFETCEARDGAEAVSKFILGEFDLVILDIMMPRMDGMEACRRIRQTSEVPIIFLSAKDEEADKVVGFALGADDYVTKPFKPRELVARVKARLRRSQSSHATDSTFRTENFEVDPRAHRATLHDQPLELTPKEFDLLALLVSNAGHPVSAQELFEGVWKEPYQSSDANTIMVHIRRLRKKLAAIDSSQSHIETVFGVGYKVAGTTDENEGAHA